MQTNLYEGKMTIKEIAKWRGITYSSFRKYKDRYLTELSSFCDFTVHYGYLMISNIICPTYIKNFNSSFSRAYVENVRKKENGLTSLSGMTEELKDQYPQLSESGLKKCLSKGGVATYGVTDNKEGSRRYYQWAIKIAAGRNKLDKSDRSARKKPSFLLKK